MADKRRPLSDAELRAAVDSRFKDALTNTEELSREREKAWDFYYGRPLGNEIDGRSQVVARVTMDSVEWMMPSLMRIFATRSAIQFDPSSPEDEALARQETAAVNHVIWKQNQGFLTIYEWIKYALLQKVGYIQYRWEDEESVTTERYQGLTQDAVTALVTQLEGEGAKVEVEAAEIGATAPGVPQMIDVELKITRTRGRLRIETIPPEEVFVSSDCKGSIKDAKFAGRIRSVSRGELLAMGIERKRLDILSDYSFTRDGVETARDMQGLDVEDDDGVDWATQEFQILDAYLLVDADGDGYAERRHVLMDGDGFLVNEEVDEVYMCSMTPLPVPGKHAGLDLYDLTEAPQRIQTGLTRSLLDNAYFSVNRRLAYNRNTVDEGMLQINRPGGHVAVDGPPTGEIFEIPVSDVGVRLLPVIQYFEDRTERSVGAGGRMQTGVDADVLAQSTKGAYMSAATAANQRIEAIARVMAETGFADLFSSVHRMLRKYQDWPIAFKQQDSWVQANPADWNERENLTVSVGLGTSSKEEVRANLGLIGQAMQMVGQMPGLIQPRNVFAYFRRLQTELGFENEPFITDPDSGEYQQWAAAQNQAPPPDPYVVGKQMDGQIKLQERMIDAALKREELAQERDLAITKLEVETGVDLAKAGIGAEVALARGANPARAGGGRAAGQPPVGGGA